MKNRLVRKAIVAAVLTCAFLLQIPAVQAAPPLVLGYFTNWSIYWAKYTPDKIPTGDDEVLYAFEMVWDCDPLKPQKENNYSQASRAWRVRTIRASPSFREPRTTSCTRPTH